MKLGAPVAAGVESAHIVCSHALDQQGFTRAHCLVHRVNVRVWKSHKRFGAQRVAEIGDQYEYRMSPEVIRSSVHRYGRYLPEPITAEYEQASVS